MLAPTPLLHLTFPIQQIATVLIIDDNPDVIALFQRYLAGAYHTSGTTLASAGFQMAQTLQPDVILLDVMIPEQDGWELLQRLQNHPATAAIPVIVCSVLPERTLALSLGASELLTKPVTQATLLAALAQHAKAAVGATDRA